MAGRMPGACLTVASWRAREIKKMCRRPERDEEGKAEQRQGGVHAGKVE